MIISLLISSMLSFAHASSYEDVQPIFKTRCYSCHNENWCSKNWMNYDNVFENREKIKFRLSNYTMPPGNSTNMTKEERKTIIDWINQGASR